MFNLNLGYVNLQSLIDHLRTKRIKMNSIKGKNLLQRGIFTEEEEMSVINFIEGTLHRHEFSDLVLHCYNFNAYSNSSLAQLLRYVDREQLKGLFLFLEYFSAGKSTEQLLSADFMHEILDSKPS